MRILAFVLAALLVAAAQAVLLRWIGGGAIPIQLLVPCLAWLALETEAVEGAVAAAGIGWVMNVHAATPWGLFVFLGVLVFLGCRAAGMGVDLRGRAGFALLSAGACLGLSIAALLVQGWAGDPASAPGAGLAGRLLGEAVLTGLAAPAIQAGMRRLDARLGGEEPGLAP